MAKRTASNTPAKSKTETSAKQPANPKTKSSGKTTAARAPKPQLMVTVSGIRGIAGQALTAHSITPYIDAYARMCSGKRIILGHDARPSARWIIPLAEGILRSHGIDVAHVGLIPTPTVGLLTRKLKAAGGICITASHNPIEYNGLKFFGEDGKFIAPEKVEELKRLASKASAPVESGKIGKAAFLADAAEHHLNELLSAFPPPDKLRTSKRPRVIIDCCNSTGVEIAPDVADAYGALFQMINSDTTAMDFPRPAEPLPKNIIGLCQAVVKEGADLGFAIDPDADRLALVDENGRAIGEERTLLLAADAFLSMEKTKAPIVVNLSTSRAIDDLAAQHGISVVRTAIGEANVLAEMAKQKSKIGGEGNGGVIVPRVQPGRDAATGIALILMGLQSNGCTLSEWNARFPDYCLLKESAPLGKVTPKQALSKVKRAFSKAKIDETDGVKASFEESWIHVRPSNTEPIIRIYAEALEEAEARELVEKAAALVQ